MLNKTQQIKSSGRTRKRGLVVKLMVGGRGLTFCFSPVLLALLAAALFCTWQGFRKAQDLEQSRYQARIDKLEEENRRIQTFLARKEKEKRQMLALAQARGDELLTEIETRDREIEQIWKVVGKAPRKPTKSAAHSRHSLSGSRGLNALAVKRRYLELQHAVAGRETEVDRLDKAAKSYRREKIRQAELAALNQTPSIWPTSGIFSSGFGYRVHPILGYGRFHSGVDISAPTGTPIRATAAGRVVNASYYGGYGLAVVIDHGNGLQTLYGHCSAVAVGPGAFVKKGQLVSYVGSTGMSTGPHCHYEVSVNGTQVDPLPYMK